MFQSSNLNNKSVIFYKYPWEKNFSFITFLGSSISTTELRVQILRREEKSEKLIEKIKRRLNDFLELYSVTYDLKEDKPISEEENIPANTQVLIKRANKSILNCMPTSISQLFDKYGIDILDLKDIEENLVDASFLLIRPNDKEILNRAITSKTWFTKLAWMQSHLNKKLILIFAAHGTGKFQGYAKVSSFSFTNNGGVKLNLVWLRINELNFATVSKELITESKFSGAAVSSLSAPVGLRICELFESSLIYYDFSATESMPQTSVLKSMPPVLHPLVEMENRSTCSDETEVSSSKINTGISSHFFTPFDEGIEEQEIPLKKINKVLMRDPRRNLPRNQNILERSRSRSQSK